jgi:predicted deacylase
VRLDRVPLTYAECRGRFLREATVAGVAVAARPIAATGPDGAELCIDVAMVGADRPRRTLVVLSGVHGVEGFLPSTLQTDLVSRLDPATLPRDVGVLLIHAVNPWGMAWWRRQNESNVDLNRNWCRSETIPVHNEAYDELHAMACPDSDGLPDVDEVLSAAADLVRTRGLAWVRDGLTAGQYRHPDGLHFGGDRTEESTAILEAEVATRLIGVERVLTIDLHTGHGPPGAVTALSSQPPGTMQDAMLRTLCDRVEATGGNADATTGPKSGSIATGIAGLLPGATCVATALEFGTTPDLEQLAATYQEHWVHRRGDRTDPAHAAAIWRYRACFTPDDPGWETAAVADGRTLLDRAVEAVASWA